MKIEEKPELVYLSREYLFNFLKQRIQHLNDEIAKPSVNDDDTERFHLALRCRRSECEFIIKKLKLEVQQ